MRRFLFAIIALFVILSVAGLVCVRFLFAENRAIGVIEKNGAAVSKPIPAVTVFVPQSRGGEKSFGDQQLLAIIPVLKDVDKFAGLQLNGSSITDASVGQLKSVNQLQSLDVSNTAVTVKGLLELRALPKLRSIRTGALQLSGDDRKALSAAMPKVDVQ